MADELPYDVPECDCCGFKNPVGGLKEYTRERAVGKKMNLCRLCACTYAGLAYDYHKEDLELFKTICWIGNQLRADLARREVGDAP